MISLLRRRPREATDGNLRQAVWQPGGVCHIVHFFRDVHGTYPITKEALRQRTNEYNRWVDAFARKQDIPIEWAQKGVRKEDYVRPALHRMERQ